MKMQVVCASITPEMCNEPQRFKLRLENGDTVEEFKRESSKGGKFEQYKLFLTDANGQKREANFLFMRDLNALTEAWGGESEKWAGHYVRITKKTEKRNGEKYDGLKIEPDPVDADDAGSLSA